MKGLCGLTDGPPHTMSARQLATSWLDGRWDGERWREQEVEWSAPDGSFMYRVVEVDLDYQMGYLFQVTAPDNGSVDHLAVFVRHGRHPVKGWNLDVEWHNRPLADNTRPGRWSTTAHHWFVDWVSARSS